MKSKIRFTFVACLIHHRAETPPTDCCSALFKPFSEYNAHSMSCWFCQLSPVQFQHTGTHKHMYRHTSTNTHRHTFLLSKSTGESHTYLIFVISFTQAGFLNSKVLHPKTTQNTHKLQQIPQKDVKYAVICVQSGKFYTGENFFTRAPPVVPVTNMRYESMFIM